MKWNRVINNIMGFKTLENILKKRNLDYILEKNDNKIELDFFMNIFNFPRQIYSFYSEYKYLFIKEPPIEIYPLNKLVFLENKYLIFSCVNNKHKLAYDTSILNDANQWSIFNIENKHFITMTMSSFCSNKLINWIDKKREIWNETIEKKCDF